MPYKDLETKRQRERERRRERYASDPEFRERVLDAQKRWKTKNPGTSEATRRWDQDNHARKMELQRARRDADPAKYLWRHAYDRARKKGVPFSITVDDVVVPEVCPVLGFPMVFGVRHSPFAPSLDRIRPELGYVPGNVQIISNRANMMKNEASPEELVRFARWVLSVTEVVE